MNICSRRGSDSHSDRSGIGTVQFDALYDSIGSDTELIVFLFAQIADVISSFFLFDAMITEH